jgi:endonuclease/exonuclease/phosphatase (EEP) superfamily protein YafD
MGLCALVSSQISCLTLNAAMPTWMVDTLIGIPIDHALAQKPLNILLRTLGPEVGSDHRPILIEVGWVR